MKVLNLLNYAVIATSLIASLAAHAEIYDGLSSDDRASINNGEQVVQTEDVDGSAWPRITVLQRVEATPEELAGVMFDYALHKSMFEGVTQSDATTPGAQATDVVYTMGFPKVLGISLPDEHYTVRDTLSVMGGSGFQVSWTLVKASTMKDCNGAAQFEKLGNATLVRYTNFISPPRPAMARLITKMAITRVKDTVKALSAKVLSERNSDQAKLNTQKAAVAKALGH